ncbi:MAG TPA: DUF4443 domain-containing protein [Candidatus Korarchaeota archaeon]|nr:DUF4443 domain-containing protein [Candidatus Korarchaeota archaeon]
MSPPKRVSVERITISRISTAILVRGVAEKVGNGMRVRDAAVSQGASGATTLTFIGGKLQIPGVSQDAETDFPEEVRSLVEELKPRDGDAIILGTAERWRDANLGAIAGALCLLGVGW